MRREHGFTLIEMMIVILVIAVLATIVGIGIRNAGERSKQSTLSAQLKAVNDALALAQQAWNSAEGAMPGYTLEQLNSETAPDGAQDWQGPYLTEIPIHPYGGTFVYDEATNKYVSAPA